MYKSLILLCLVSVIYAQYNDLDSIINTLFGQAPTPTQAPINTLRDSEAIPCTTDNGQEGRCVHYYLCDNNNIIIYDGNGLMDIRSGTDRFRRNTREVVSEDRRSSYQANKCNSYLDQCCIFPELRKKDNPITPRPYKQIRNSDGGCGWRNIDGVGFKSTNDKVGESKFGEFPWMVAILKMVPVNIISGRQLNTYIGGGSLIHPSVVLTTAHHLSTTKTLKVRAGEWNTHTRDERYPHQDRDVNSTIVHKNFNTKRNNLYYDIALLFLTSSMDTSIPNVGVACLPPPRQHIAKGTPCIASGWGKDKFGWEGKYQIILKKVTVPVVEREQCQTWLRKTRLGTFFELHSSFMCAGAAAGIDTCKGDSGSPLMCPVEDQPNRYMQSGMVAWGIGCGEEGIPGVYVDVSNLRDWIDDTIVSKGLDPKVYTF